MAPELTEELLRPSEIKALTGSANPDEQDRVLTREGIPHRRLGRRILVSRFHTREWLAGRPVAPTRGFNLAMVK